MKIKKCNDLGRWRNTVEIKHEEMLKNEKELRTQATWDAAEARKQMDAMQLQLTIAEKRLEHHLEQEKIRLEEEEKKKIMKNNHNEREKKKY